MKPVSIALSIFYAVFLLEFQRDALTRLGISPLSASWLVSATLIGGFVDLPCFFRTGSGLPVSQVQGVFGLGPLWRDPWGRPRVQWVAVNVGGFVVPLMVSLAALIRVQQQGVPWWKVLAIGAAVTAVSYAAAEVVPDRGVQMRPLWPALVAALLANGLCPGTAPLVAYPCGVLGVLLGADLLNLPKVLRQGVPFVSVGGAGTFDGIVVTGIMASLLAGS